MATIDDKVVAMSFESTKFETGISTSLNSLQKLSDSLKRVGSDTSLHGLETSSNKINFLGIGTALDKLKAKFGFGREAAAFNEIEQGANKVTLSGIGNALDKLKGKLGFPEADRAFAGIETASGRVSLSGLGKAIDGVGVHFSAMQVAGVAALSAIVAKAAMAGAEIVKSLTVSPVTGGLKEYETQLNAVQTILSNTKASGATLGDVNKALKELNHYADKTIYNFTEMAKNIGTFTAAGVDLKTATASIKGIANLAALSGSNSQQASTAMYQLSQAISSGRVSLQDWNSVVNAGMGGTVFQRALAQTAERMGTLDKGAVSLTGKMKNVSIEGKSFRESIMSKPGQESWLTSKVLTSTLKQLSGDMTDAQLKAEGFSDAQIKAIQAQAKMAVNAATQVKTLSGVFETAKEAAGSGWAETWQIIFGDFGEAKTLFTGVSNALNGFIGASAKARNAVLGDWKELGGRTALIEGIKNIFVALGSVLKPIKEAFRDIFPPKTGMDLYHLTLKFREFTHALRIGPETAENLKRSFAGVFALLSIGKQVVFGLVGMFFKLFGAAGKGSGGILKVTGGIGDFLVSIDAALKKGNRLNKFFDALAKVLSTPIELLKTLGRAVGGLFNGVNADDAKEITKSLGDLTDKLKPSKEVIEGAKRAWEGFLRVVERVKTALEPAVDAIVNVFQGVGQQIERALAENDFDSIFQIIQTGLIGGIFLTIKKALGKGLEFDFGGGVLKNLSQSMEVLQGSLVSMQTSIKAGTLLKISAAVALLAVAVVALSNINPEKLASSMTAIAIGFGQLLGAMAILTTIGGSTGFLKAPIIASGLVVLAVAINVLALAVRQLSGLSWEELAKGLGGIAGLLATISVAAGPLTAAGPGLVRASVGLVALGVGLNVIALAVRAFGSMDWLTIGKGLVGIAGALVAIGVAVNLIPPTVLVIGPGLIAVGVALGVIAGAVLAFGSMNWETLGKGLGAIAAAMVGIGLAMAMMPPNMILSAAALMLVSVALAGLVAAVGLLGNMDFGTLVKGIAGLAAALAVLAIGLTAMVVALPGAAALLVASAALAIFAPVLGILGSMKWSTIVKGLAAMGLAFVVIGTAGLIAAPALTLLGLALVGFGVGVLAVGTGVNLLAKGLVLLGSDGSKGVGVLIAAMTAMIAVIPKMVIDFLTGLVKILASIAELAPKIVESIVKIAIAMADGVIKMAPKFAEATGALVMAMLKVLGDNAGPMIEAGWKLLRQLMSGLADNIHHVTTTMATIVTRFLGALADRIPSVITAGAKALAAMLKGIANNLSDVVEAGGEVIARFVLGLGKNAVDIVKAGFNAMEKFINEIGRKSSQLVTAGARVILDFVEGLGDNGTRIVKAGFEAMEKFINEIGRKSSQLVTAGAKALLDFLEGVERKLKEDDYIARLGRAGGGIAGAIITGVARGIAAGAGEIIKQMQNLASDALRSVRKKLGIDSPSKEMAKVGRYMMDGWSRGLDQNGDQVNVALTDIVDTMGQTLSTVPNILDGLVDLDPTITPVLDLTRIREDAKRLVDLTNVAPVTATASYGYASGISVSDPGAIDKSSVLEERGVSIHLEQHNTSPVALSETEIYRRTHNQLSQAKALVLP